MQKGACIPAQIFIHDYAHGSIPDWTIVEIEQYDFLLVLTLIDPASCSESSIDGCVVSAALGVFLPERTLSGPTFLYFLGCIHARNMLCDIRQDVNLGQTWY